MMLLPLFLLPTMPLVRPAAAQDPAALGTVVVDTRVPVELRLDRDKVATLLVPSVLHLGPLAAGSHELTVLRAGASETVEVEVLPAGRADVLVTVDGVVITSAGPVEPASASAIRLLSPSGGALVWVDGRRWRLEPGQVVHVGSFTAGVPVEVRSADGSVVWARGTLVPGASPELTLVVAEGRVPSVVGGGPRTWVASSQ